MTSNFALGDNPPGVFIEEIALPPGVPAVETAVPAFIGYTEKGDAGAPTRISSLADFEEIFGGAEAETGLIVTVDEVTADPATSRPASLTVTVTRDDADRSKHILYYALQHFYANGGRVAFVISAGTFTADGPALGALRAGLASLAKQDGPTLIVIPEASALDNAGFRTVTEATLAQCAERGDRFAIIDAHDAEHPFSAAGTDVRAAVRGFRTEATPTENLRFGAAYAPHLATTLGVRIDEPNLVVTHTRDGVAASVPLAGLREQNPAAYDAVMKRIRELPLVLPPSAAVAGVHAQVDAAQGVWKSPANMPVARVIEPVLAFSAAEQDMLALDPDAGKSINAIRTFPGRGTLVWGARTLAGNDNEWRYVSVRRFALFVEQSVERAIESFTFEPNDAPTWAKLQAMIEDFLTTQWRAGALQGVKPEQAFYVAVGLGRTMTEQDVLDGRLIVEVGLAVVRPAEFVVLRFTHLMAAG